MKNILSTILTVGSLAFAIAVPGRAADGDPKPSTYDVDKTHSQIAFKVRHLGISDVTGTFSQYNVNLTLDPADVSTLTASTVLDVSSIDTGVARRDAHLKSGDFFDAELHPEIVFVSKETRPAGDNRFEITGDLTIRNETREVVLEGEMVGPVVGAMGEERIAFNATGSISRAAFGLQWNKLTEAGGIIVGDEVKIILDLSAVKGNEGI